MNLKFSTGLIMAAMAATGFADTKGLNQVVTSTITPVGVFTASFQYQHPTIGDIYTTQFEFGVTKGTEATVWQSFDSNTLTLAGEAQIYKKGIFQFSGGSFWFDHTFLPFAVGAVRTGPYYFEVGGQYQTSQGRLVLGASYDFNPQLTLMFDYISGAGNALTGGVTWNASKMISLNPAMYYMNDTHRYVPYLVVTFTFGS